MTPLTEFLQWYNFLFVFPLFAGLVALLFSAYGVALEAGGEGEHEAEGSMEHEAAEVEHDVEHEVEGQVEHDLEHAAEAPGEHEGEHHLDHEAHEHGLGSTLAATLAFLGTRDAPLTLVFESLILWWGIIGWIANQYWSRLWPNPGHFIWPSMATALAGSLLLTRGTARLIGRFLPKEATAALGKEDLEAEVGEVVFAVTQESGWVHVYDRYGTLHQVPARTEPEHAPIPRGKKVLLVRYDRQREVFWVEPADWWEEEGPSEVRMMEEPSSLREGTVRRRPKDE